MIFKNVISLLLIYLTSQSVVFSDVIKSQYHNYKFLSKLERDTDSIGIKSKNENCESARKKYLEANPDVKAAGVDPWSHYKTFGIKEGRKWFPCPEHQTENNIESNKFIENVNSSIFSKDEIQIDELGLACIKRKKHIFKKKKIKFYTYFPDKRHGEWSGKSKSGLVNGDGEMKVYENDTLIMVSKCTYLNGYKEGYSYDSSQNFVFYGFYKKGKRHGKGKITGNNGEFYEGDWVDGKIHGKGRYIYNDGAIYEGDWVNDMKHGKGRFTLVNGAFYEGDWVNNMKHGKGKITGNNGEFYEGDWVDDKRHGKGRYRFNDGAIYEGDWVDGKIHGKGKITYNIGDSYEGDWVDDKKHGKGRYRFNDGAIYEGDWVNNLRHGKGKITYNDGGFYEGDWLDDKRHGKGRYRFDDGAVYEGDWVNNMKHGKGKITYNDGAIYERDLGISMREGFGTDLHYIEGNWYNDELNGSAFERYSDGSHYDGEWKDGVLISKKNIYESNTYGKKTENRNANKTKEDIFFNTDEDELRNDFKKIINEYKDIAIAGSTGEWQKNTKNCHNCKGKGVVNVCPICDKKGKIICKQCRGYKVSNDGSICRNCLGSGVQTCEGCKGKVYNVKCQHTIWQFQR